MAAESGARRGRIGGLMRSPEQVSAYGRAVLLALAVAAGLTGLALAASRLRVNTGTILLFAAEQPAFWAGGLALTLLASGLTARLRPPVRPDEDPFAPRLATPAPSTAPILPAVATFGGVLLISLYHDRATIVAAPAVIAPVVLAAAVARYHLDDELGRVRRIARIAHVLLTHGVAFLTLATIYINKVRSVLSASTVAIVACLLLVQIADGEHFPADRRLIYGLAGGLILGEITWALNYWPLTGWTGGAVLLIAFYLVAGLILAQAREGLRRRDLLEYGLSAAVMFAIVALSLR